MMKVSRLSFMKLMGGLVLMDMAEAETLVILMPPSEIASGLHRWVNIY